MKKIILPTDFSDNAYNAISYALRLFREETCTFYLVNTYTPAVYQAEYVLHSPSQIGLGDMYQSHSMEQLDELKARLDKDFGYPGHTLITHSAFNTVVDEVIDMVDKEGADLIVMGTQGATGAKEILLGTHTVHVLQRAQCPIIVIPSGFAFEVPSGILFPTDFEVDYRKVALAVLLGIARSYTSKIEIMHVATGYELTLDQKANKKQLETLMKPVAHRFHDLPGQEIITAINTFQERAEVNFLVMVKNKHTFMERLFIEPVIKKITFHVTIPLMVIPA